MASAVFRKGELSVIESDAAGAVDVTVHGPVDTCAISGALGRALGGGWCRSGGWSFGSDMETSVARFVRCASVMTDETRAAMENLHKAFLGAVVRKDDESAHGLADDIWRLALEAISSGEDGAQEIARLAMRTEEHDYRRWCA